LPAAFTSAEVASRTREALLLGRLHEQVIADAGYAFDVLG
jgi:hypothetical protein